MKSIRLLPVVILAAVALLVLKGGGLLTSGGYVLLGTESVFAAGGGHETPAAEGGEPAMTLPAEPTMTDTSPTLADGAPTLGSKDDGHGNAAEEHADAPHGEASGEDAVEPGEHSDAPVVPNLDCPDGTLSRSEIAESIAHATTGHDAPSLDGCPPPDPRAEGVPMIETGAGTAVPLSAEGGGTLTEEVVLERLGARRAELDAREAEIAMRLLLVEAAEKRLEERTAALLALEARIQALVEEKKAMEEGEFKSLIGMYEQMKPREAALIFDQLDMSVMVRVARGISPRKMAPILASMTPERAKDLTTRMATLEAEPTINIAPQAENLAELPQIVGQ